MAARLLCILQLLWFIFYLSSVLHSCVKFIVLLIVHFLKYNVCWLDFKINASRTESWKYNPSIMHIISPLPWYESPHSFRSISRQKKYKAFETFLGMFTLVCLMNIYIWCHFLPNSACAKIDSAMVQWCDIDGALRNNNGSIDHRFIVIIPSHRRDRTITNTLS